ncbi:hypothetical protein SV7mr_06400 [Stieleria bergensis]|uniref:Uncharacterized protein n=1 Tax=Stieleria bergensis TaxID=2528025 RepID=A0A517SPV1_9BACT|nr:hypothetical protein SV7mr_06400 [Planctomycetes bacterium SV_7m_r]
MLENHGARIRPIEQEFASVNQHAIRDAFQTPPKSWRTRSITLICQENRRQTTR